MSEGEDFRTALKDSLITESASIVLMEAVAIGVEILLARDAGLPDPIFSSSLAVSLTAGLVAAYPVNLWMVRAGVKEGMADPRGAPAPA